MTDHPGKKRGPEPAGDPSRDGGNDATEHTAPATGPVLILIVGAGYLLDAGANPTATHYLPLMLTAASGPADDPEHATLHVIRDRDSLAEYLPHLRKHYGQVACELACCLWARVFEAARDCPQCRRVAR